MTGGTGGTGPEQGGQPPHGQPPPYGQPYSYWPAPPVAAGRPPAALERPVAVRAGLGAFIAAVVFSVVGSVVSLLNWDRVVGEALATVQDEQLREAGVDAAELAEFGARLGIGVTVVITLAQLLFIWSAWQGRGWARIVLWVLGGLGLAFGLPGLLGAGSPLPSLTALGVFQFLALAVGIVLLALRPANDWYRSEKARRAMTGRR